MILTRSSGAQMHPQLKLRANVVPLAYDGSKRFAIITANISIFQKLWEIGDIVALVEASDAVPSKRGPYKKAAA